MRRYFFFLAFILFIALFLTELYLKKIGLGDPVRYDSNILYGYSAARISNDIDLLVDPNDLDNAINYLSCNNFLLVNKI